LRTYNEVNRERNNTEQKSKINLYLYLLWIPLAAAKAAATLPGVQKR
jgi:hypothetical protein